MLALQSIQMHNTFIATQAIANMQTYNVLVECADEADDRIVQVETIASLENCDEDMLASEIEACLEEQHNLVIGDNLLHWEFTVV
jgi:hypothetical protein